MTRMLIWDPDGECSLTLPCYFSVSLSLSFPFPLFFLPQCLVHPIVDLLTLQEQAPLIFPGFRINPNKRTL
jgi:hypothetical protein